MKVFHVSLNAPETVFHEYSERKLSQSILALTLIALRFLKTLFINVYKCFLLRVSAKWFSKFIFLCFFGERFLYIISKLLIYNQFIGSHSSIVISKLVTHNQSIRRYFSVAFWCLWWVFSALLVCLFVCCLKKFSLLFTFNTEL